MAVGASDAYWKDARLPGVIKHGILRRYLPIFLARTSSYDGRAVYIDGYAGRGYYENGDPGSAGMLLEMAKDQKVKNGAVYSLRFFEKDRDNYTHLARHVSDFVAQGVDATCSKADVGSQIKDALADADGSPLFLFLDPCGVGLPFETVVTALNRPRTTKNWPPTELLMNFSYEAIRRIGGVVCSPNPIEATMARLDTALGGKWWREHFEGGVSDTAVDAVVTGFIKRLNDATGMAIGSVPVRRKHHHKPIYSLVYATRSNRGFWHFCDVTAKSGEEWRLRLENSDPQQALIGDQASLADTETLALPVIEKNLLKLVADKGVSVQVGDYPFAVFGEFMGEVREALVRKAIKSLHRQGLTPSDGTGGKTENLYVSP